MKQRVWISGATGFIGRAIAERFERGGWDVAGMRRPGSKTDQRARWEEVSLFDPNALARAMQGSDVIVHAAGLVDGDLPRDLYRWVHIAATENVLRAAKHAGASRLLYVSCASVVLSDEERVHWDEKRDLAQPALGMRAQSIKLAEELVMTGADDSLSVVALRPSWVWGAGDWSRLPALVREARRGGLRLFGDGKNLVALSHIAHVAEAAWLAARAPNASGQTYYVGDAEFLEMGEFLGKLSEALGLPRPRAAMPGWAARIAARTPLAPASLETIVERSRGTLFDTQKLGAELGFTPHVTLEDGLTELAAWVKEQGGLDAIAAHQPTVTALPDVLDEAKRAEQAADALLA